MTFCCSLSKLTPALRLLYLLFPLLGISFSRLFTWWTSSPCSSLLKYYLLHDLHCENSIQNFKPPALVCFPKSCLPCSTLGHSTYRLLTSYRIRRIYYAYFLSCISSFQNGMLPEARDVCQFFSLTFPKGLEQGLAYNGCSEDVCW